MSAVKNLRAMFEQKGDTSPPDRGRSPAPSIPPAGGTDSPRPLSKVRTSFIMVEKDGRMGLAREGSQDSSSALRRPYGDSTVTTPTTATERSNPFDMILKSPPTSLKSQPILESAPLDSGSKATTPPVTPPVQVTQDVKPTSPAATSTASNCLGLNGATDKKAASGSPEIRQPAAESLAGTGSAKVQQKPTEKETAKSVEKEAAKSVEKEAAKSVEKEAAKFVEKGTTKPTTRTTRPTPKPLAGLSASKAAAKPLKSPTAHKTPKTPTTASHHPVAKKTPDKKAHPPEKPATARVPAVSSKASGPSSIKKPPALHPLSTTTTFIKPKIKSPTRPVRLPPSLTTHTTSSGGKVNVPRQSFSRAGGVTHSVSSHGRPASSASVSTGDGASTKPAAAKGLKRQSSTIGRPRPSLGLPPKPVAKDHPPIKREKEVDEGFLARMMRPTHASASKTTEKVHTSPPRNSSAAGLKRAAVVKHAKKAAPKSTPAVSPTGQQHDPINKTTASPKQESPVREVTPVAEQSPTIAQPIAPVKEASEDAVVPQSPEATSSVGEPAASPIQPTTIPEPEPAVSAEDPAGSGQSEEAAASVEATDSAETPEAEEKEDVLETTA